MVIRNWRAVPPYVGHETKVIWPIFRSKGTEGKSYEEAPLEGIASLTFHRLQEGMEGDYHEHETKEQIYYFLRGRGKMKIDGEIHEVRDGDAVHLPPKTKHQIINDGDDWIEHLLITGIVD